jgi:phenylacetate-CoA ligase
VDGRLRELVSFARTHSPYYAEHYAGLPDEPARFADLPVVDHAAFWAANSSVGNRLLTGPHTDGIVFKTGGSTGAPRVSYYTRHEWRRMSATFGQGLPATGLAAGDRVANLFYAGQMYSSFVFTLNCLQDADLPVVQLPIGGGGSAQSVVRTIVDFDATVLAAPPTSLCGIAEHLLDTASPLPGIRLLLFSGEACYGDQRSLLTTAFPSARVCSIGYPSVDAGVLAGPVAGEADNRVHRVFRPDKVVEILDPDSGRPVTRPGVPGRIVATDLARRLMPVIRYPVGDLAEWVDHEAGTLRLLGRSEEGARVGPVTLYLDDLRAVVESADEHRTVAGMQVVLRHHGGKDQLVLRLAARPADPDKAARLIGERLAGARPMFADHVDRGLVHPLAVEWTGMEELVNPRTGKLVRLVDERAA